MKIERLYCFQTIEKSYFRKNISEIDFEVLDITANLGSPWVSNGGQMT